MSEAAPSLPPIGPTPNQSVPPFGRPPMQPQQQMPNPVGRPSNDPEAQQARAERSREQQRIESVLPRSMDSKVLVYRSNGDGRIPPGKKPVLTVLVSELEEAKKEGADTGDYISAKLEEKFRDGGRFIYKFVTRGNQTIANIPLEELIIGDEPADGSDNSSGDEGDELEQVYAQPPVFPPAPPAMDPSLFTNALREERQDEAKRGSEIASLIASQQNSTTQMMMQLAQQQRESEDRARRDTAEREERAEKRRNEFRNMILGALASAPVLAIVERFLGPKTPVAPVQDPAAAMMLEVVRAKLTETPKPGLDVTMMGEMAKLMTTMAQGNLAQQQEQAKVSAGMQSEVLGITMKTALATMKEIAEMKPQGGDKEDSTLQQIAKIAGPLLAGLQQQQAQQPQQPQQTYATEQQAQPPQAQPVPEAAPVRRSRREKVPPPVAAAVSPAPMAPAVKKKPVPGDFTDEQRTIFVLNSIRNLSIGKIPPAERFKMLDWAKDWAPAAMIEAVKAGNRDKVLELSAPAVIADAGLLAWISEERNGIFLHEAVVDLKAIIDNTLTRERMENGIIDTAKFQSESAPKQTSINPGPPQATVVTDKPVEPSAPASKGQTPPGQPTARNDEKPRRRRAPKENPPATPPTAPPAGT